MREGDPAPVGFEAGQAQKRGGAPERGVTEDSSKPRVDLSHR